MLIVNEQIQYIFLLTVFIILVITRFIFKYFETFWVKRLYAILRKNDFK